MTELYNPFTDETVVFEKGIGGAVTNFARGMRGQAGSLNNMKSWNRGIDTRGQLNRAGRKVKSGWSAVTREGDANLASIGIKSPTAAYTTAGALGAAGTIPMRRENKRLRAESFGKGVSGKEIAAYGGAIGGGLVAGEAGGRELGKRRYRKGKGDVGAMFQGGSIARGYAHEAKKAKEVSKAGYGGAGLPDRCYGASTPSIGQTRQVATPSLKGGFRATGLKLERFTGLSGDYSGMPENRGKKGAHKLGHYKKGRDRAAREFVGKSFTVDYDELGRQPGMINPGIQTSSWSHGMTPNQNFSRSQGARGRKIS